ncbi:carbohydrate kinase family protein [Ruminococcaceae bacterium OttesenSCG-928-I18]|nr:carbohydrate kinase family protein [Ruminococcaceae bacterium OttesenSCG-928-I18]
MEKEFDIVTIGIAAYDMILRTVDESLFTRDTTMLQEVGVSSGGGAMTQAVIAQRLGCKTALMGKISSDIFGDYLQRILKDAGVDDSRVVVSSEDSMSLTFALVRPDGTRHFLGWQGSNNRTLCLDDIDLSLVKKAKIVSYGSFYFLQEMDKGGANLIFRTAKDAGALTVADVGADAFSQGKDVIFSNLPLLDYFIPSYVEAEYLTGEKDPARMASFFLRKGCRNVIIKLGAEGCFVASEHLAKTIPTFNEVKANDTTGAGDNFVGGFLAGLIDGRDVLDAARFANAVASVSVTEMGAIHGVKNKQQVLDLMNQYNDREQEESVV